MTDPRERGFSLLEMLVALALAALILLAAAQLITEAVVLIEGAGRAARNPSLILAMAALRRDVQEAAGLSASQPVSWTRSPLELVGWDGSRSRVVHQGDALVRITLDPAGKPSGRRVLTRGVISWWWRAVNPRTLDLRVTAVVAPSPRPGGRSTADRHTETWRFAMRGAPAGRSW